MSHPHTTDPGRQPVGVFSAKRCSPRPAALNRRPSVPRLPVASFRLSHARPGPRLPTRHAPRAAVIRLFGDIARQIHVGTTEPAGGAEALAAIGQPRVVARPQHVVAAELAKGHVPSHTDPFAAIWQAGQPDGGRQRPTRYRPREPSQARRGVPSPFGSVLIVSGGGHADDARYPVASRRDRSKSS